MLKVLWDIGLDALWDCLVSLIFDVCPCNQFRVHAKYFVGLPGRRPPEKRCFLGSVGPCRASSSKFLDSFEFLSPLIGSSLTRRFIRFSFGWSFRFATSLLCLATFAGGVKAHK